MIFVVEAVSLFVSADLANRVVPVALFIRNPPLAVMVGAVTACAGAAVRAPVASIAPVVTATAAALRTRRPLVAVIN
ncbi:hypothetical protein GCM10022233_45090 [Streptomyces shaanxiensis]|uniref:Uncharacterized protein n=1 Tax=Streptomyces shaanxiensis TaxID=653357 RepID=A0ABP7VE73_9ACTN